MNAHPEIGKLAIIHFGNLVENFSAMWHVAYSLQVISRQDYSIIRIFIFEKSSAKPKAAWSSFNVVQFCKRTRSKIIVYEKSTTPSFKHCWQTRTVDLWLLKWHFSKCGGISRQNRFSKKFANWCTKGDLSSLEEAIPKMTKRSRNTQPS